MADAVNGGTPPVADLWDAERRLWEAFGRGEPVDLRVGDPVSDDPLRGDSWGASRQVRAEVVAALLLGAVQPVAGYVPGVSLTGALIVGDLDVQKGVVGYAAALRECRFDGALLLAEATTRTVDLSGSVLGLLDASAAAISGHLLVDQCRTGPIMLDGAHISGRWSLNGTSVTVALFADRVTVDSGMFCRFGFHAEGESRLVDAQIRGSLDMTGAHLANPGQVALSADRLRVEGSLACSGGFRADGQISLNAARIGGQVSFNSAHLANPGQIALNANRLTTDSSMFCGEGFQVDGEMRLHSAHIGGQLSFEGAHLASPGQVALSADRLNVEDGLFCEGGFRADGEIRLAVARIGGELSLIGAHIANSGGSVLYAGGLTVDGAIFCEDGFRADGTVSLIDAHVSETLSFSGATLANPGGMALNIRRLRADSLRLDDLAVTGTVDLTSAQVRAFHDDPGHWPDLLLLDGLTYDDLRPYEPVNGRGGRLAWLSRDEPGYRAQPYEQLATYYRRLGHDDEARRVLIAKQRRRRAGLRIPSKIFGYTLDVIVGYGYRPVRAFGWLAVLLAIGSMYFTANRPAPVDPVHYPHYQPVLYAADLVIPIVNLGQAGVWAPAGAAQWVAAALVASGWILATSVIAGITRILARA